MCCFPSLKIYELYYLVPLNQHKYEEWEYDEKWGGE